MTNSFRLLLGSVNDRFESDCYIISESSIYMGACIFTFANLIGWAKPTQYYYHKIIHKYLHMPSIMLKALQKIDRPTEKEANALYKFNCIAGLLMVLYSRDWKICRQTEKGTREEY